MRQEPQPHPGPYAGGHQRGRRGGATQPSREPAVLAPALALAAPPAVTALLAAAPSLVDLPGPDAALPVAALLLVVVQVVGVLLAREAESATWGRVWLGLLATTVLLLPLLALHVAAARVPFVSLARGSAGPLVWGGVGAALAIVGVALLAAVVSAAAPDQASLVYLPASLLVPTLLAAPGTLDEPSALAALARAAAVAAAAAFLGWLLPPSARPLVGPVALGAQFLLLRLLGQVPAPPPGSGAVVPVLANLLLAIVVVATVLTPLAARAAALALASRRRGAPSRHP